MLDDRCEKIRVEIAIRHKLPECFGTISWKLMKNVAPSGMVRKKKARRATRPFVNYHALKLRERRLRQICLQVSQPQSHGSSVASLLFASWQYWQQYFESPSVGQGHPSCPHLLSSAIITPCSNQIIPAK